MGFQNRLQRIHRQHCFLCAPHSSQTSTSTQGAILIVSPSFKIFMSKYREFKEELLNTRPLFIVPPDKDEPLNSRETTHSSPVPMIAVAVPVEVHTVNHPYAPLQRPPSILSDYTASPAEIQSTEEGITVCCVYLSHFRTLS
jgi:hypothetical protein